MPEVRAYAKWVTETGAKRISEKTGVPVSELDFELVAEPGGLTVRENKTGWRS